MKKINSDFTKNEIFEIASEFKKRRNYLNLTQSKLSKLSNLSQSIITKFENCKIDPTYSTILKIERALEEEENLTNLKAKDIMIKNIISISPKTKIFDALKIMRENDYSQLLIIENEIPVGAIYEKTILDIMSEKIDIYKTEIKKYIENPPILIPKNYPIRDLAFIFNNKKTKFILVFQKNKILGIITKSDLFKTKK